MRLLILLVFLFGCTTVEAPIVTTSDPGTGGEGGGPPETSTDAATGTGGESGSGSGGATSTTSGTAGSGGTAPELGACLGYDEGLLASCKQPIDADGCEALFGEDGSFSDVCPTANLVGCCRRAQEYTCYYSPEFNDDMATYCESDAGGNGTWEAP